MTKTTPTQNQPNNLFRLLFLPAPFIRRSIPLIGGKSLFELMVASVVFIICAASAVPSKNGAGSIASILAALAITFALRNNTIYSFFGLAFERALYWHKILALICYVVILIHGIGEGMNGTGVVLAALMMSMGLLYTISSANFNTFYFTHVAFAGLVMIFAFAHGAVALGICGLIWLAEIIVRYAFAAKIVQASVLPISNTLLKVTFRAPEHFVYQPGQYCFLMVRSINKYEYHPFSLASAREQDKDKATVFVKAAGDWTRSLLALAKRSTESVAVSVEGPYGSLTVDIFSAKSSYEVVVLIAGGIGVTPLLSVWAQLVALQRQKEVQKVRKVVIIWAIRDADEAEALYEHHLQTLINSSSNTSNPTNSDTSNAISEASDHLPSAPPLPTQRNLRPSSYSPLHPADRDDNDGNGNSNGNDGVDLEHHGQSTDSSSFSCEYEYHFHLTACTDEHSLPNPIPNNPSSSSSSSPNVWKTGRPDLPALFQQLTLYCMQAGYSKGAVFVCGPPPLVCDTRSCCDRYQLPCSSSKAPLASSEGRESYEALDVQQSVQFDCHEEVFAF